MDSFIPGKQAWRRVLVLIGMTLLLAACGGSDNPPPLTPVITAQPSDVSVVTGSTAGFSVTATGQSPSYQWQSSSDSGASWTDIPAATTTSYSLPSVTLADSGHLFRVLVTAAGATVASSPARLTVTATVVAPAITVPPTSQTVTEPATATFSVTATGTSPSYQWQLSTDSGTSWSNIGSATSASYTTPATVAAASGAQFRVQVSNSAGSVTSSVAVLTINAASSTNTAPSFTAQPGNQSVAAGNTATFSASVAGTPTPTLQWQRSNNNGTSWSDIAGATTNNYTTPATAAGDNGAQFRLVATNSEGSATSNAVTLTVTTGNAAPVFTAQPQDVSVEEGSDATFSAVASGVPSPAYQWQFSTDNGSTWNNLFLATASTYVQPGNTNNCGAIGRRFRVVASNSEGTTYSHDVALTVNPHATGWQCDQQLGTGRNGLVAPVVASNASGQAALVWQEDVGGTPGLYIRRYDPAQGWGTTESVAITATSSMPTYLNSGMDNQGAVTVVWVSQDGGGWRHVWAIRNTTASGWGAAAMQPLPAATADGPGYGQPLSGTTPGLAVNPVSGAATVLWSQMQCLPECGKRNLVGATFDAGGWGTLNVVYPQTASGGETYVPVDMRVAVGRNGHAVAVWERQSESTISLQAIHFTAGNVSSSVVPLTATPYSTDFYNAALAVDGSGNAIFAWEEYDTSVSVRRVHLSRYDVAGGWETPHWMGTDNYDITRGPSVAFAPNGNALVGASVYTRNAPAIDYRVAATSWTASGGWGAFETVFDTGSNFQPRVESLLDDDGVATIAVSDGSNRLKSSRRVAGASWSVPETATKTGSASQICKLMRLPDGEVLAVWLGYGYIGNVYGGIFWSNTYKPAP